MMRIAIVAVAGLMLCATSIPAQELRPLTDLGEPQVIEAWGGYIEATGDAVWTYDHPNGRLVRIDAESGAISDSTLPGYVGFQYPFVVGEDALWLPDLGTASVIKIDPATGAELAVMAPGTMRSNGAAAGAGSLWVGAYDRDADKHMVIRYDAETGAELARIASPDPIFNVIAVGDAIWVNRLRHLDRIDPATNRFIGGTPGAEYDYPMWSGEGYLWVQTLDGDILSMIDPNSGLIVHNISLGDESPARVAVGEGSVWMATQSGRLLRIDVASATITDTYASPSAVGLAVAGGSLWLLNAEAEQIWRVGIPGGSAPAPVDRATPPPKVAPKKG